MKINNFKYFICLIWDKIFGVKKQQVKRRAKIGEYVKITNADWKNMLSTGNSYKNGDIIQIKDRDDIFGTDYALVKSALFDKEIMISISSKEYVVLENYKIIDKEEKQICSNYL